MSIDDPQSSQCSNCTYELTPSNMTSTYLPILHFNDVYRVTPQKLSPNKSETIDVTQFAALVDDIRDQWPSRSEGQKDGLLLFSGDVFSPSVESSVTRGSHMVNRTGWIMMLATHICCRI